MLNTKQVRDIIRAHRPDALIYTNKTTGHKGPERRVKCYFRSDTELLFMLQTAAGAENVKVTAGGYGHNYYRVGRGIVVKCVLA
jgi:predicted TIM-barrel enzyme